MKTFKNKPLTFNKGRIFFMRKCVSVFIIYLFIFSWVSVQKRLMINKFVFNISIYILRSVYSRSLMGLPLRYRVIEINFKIRKFDNNKICSYLKISTSRSNLIVGFKLKMQQIAKPVKGIESRRYSGHSLIRICIL